MITFAVEEKEREENSRAVLFSSDSTAAIAHVIIDNEIDMCEGRIRGMTKHWDESMLALLRASPQAFVNLFLPGASYIQEQPQKLQSHQRTIDGLVEVQIDGETMLVHIEFQTYTDPEMPGRLLEYNVLIWNEYQLPVLSCVIHLLKDKCIAPSPFKRMLPTGETVVTFDYETIEISEFTVEDIIQIGEPGLLPFLTLTKEGATKEVVQRMFQELEAFADKNVTFVAFMLATFSFHISNQRDLPWLERTYRYMHDILSESPFYQEIVAVGLEKGIKQGIEQGIKTGELKALRESVVDMVRERLPSLVEFAESQVAMISDVTLLRRLVIKMSTLNDEKRAKQAFLDVTDVQ
jgi:predicted transposase/invertase (TIGR01784 family)